MFIILSLSFVDQIYTLFADGNDQDQTGHAVSLILYLRYLYDENLISWYL